MKLERGAVDALAREIAGLLERLRPVLEGSGASWPAGRGRLATAISLDLIRAVQALDVAVEELYFQADSLESAHLALEVERRAYQELFEGGPDGYLVTDPQGLILRANEKAGQFFDCTAADLVGQNLPALVPADSRSSLEAAIRGLEIADWTSEWAGPVVRFSGASFRAALTAAVVRHQDRSVYRVRWSLRDVSRRPAAD